MQSGMKSNQALPKLSFTSSSIGKVKETTLLVSPKKGTFRDWKDFPNTIDDLPVSNIAELREMPKAKAFAKQVPPDADFELYSKSFKDKVLELEYRFLDQNGDVCAVSRWSEKEGFSFRTVDPAKEALQ